MNFVWRNEWIKEYETPWSIFEKLAFANRLERNDNAFVQCFLGETAECLSQGLMDIFQHIHGVPRRLVLDNATGAGRRVGEVVRLTQLFQRFQAHFGFEVTFCNPASGHEKGNVENKVGYARRNYFVPLPSAPSLLEWNAELFQVCELNNAREHYKKDEPICTLFEADRKALLPLPELEFEACRFEHVKKLIKDLSNQYGLDVAMTSMQEAIVRKRTEGLPVNAAVVAARIVHYGLHTPGEAGPDMSRYDELLPASGGANYGSK